MTARHVRADNLGSLLRPPAVRAAYDEATATERGAIEDAAALVLIWRSVARIMWPTNGRISHQ